MIRGSFVYHRYIPNPDGTYQRQIVDDQPAPPRPEPRPPEPPVPPPTPDVSPAPEPCGACRAQPQDAHFLSRLLPKGFDTGDLLILLILLLLLIDGDEDDTLSVLLTFAAFILL